ncbi:hypothetical protein SAMN04515617_111156 [Collimonas sp. OK242]|jgi:hypothetical protein|uniref:PXPV repeat protein n=1 Tax=Collimonas sp. OK242 TaxID=1798195 RepID=UPI000897BCED|nr:PXPV repeat protein [Collimonas sp. OK242]SDY23059.1 hypothetical protein SAMN04515617_111156 [Collimonas sp. OK242]
MKRILALSAGLIAGAALMGAAAPALAQVDVGVNVRLPGVYVAPAPVYVQPRPVYVEPRPVYIEPEREGEWHERRMRAREWRENEARRGHRDHDDHRDHDHGERRGHDD